MTQQDIEAELSYAYLHAVAARAAVSCEPAGRLLDSDGVDAELHVVRDFGRDATLTDFSVHVQVKATTKPTNVQNGRYPYFLKGIERYNKLRAETVLPHRLLVVLFLPKDAKEWLKHTKDQLVLKRCAYWASLKGAPESTNDSGQTVYLPDDQPFSPEGLNALLARLARLEDLRYEP